MTRFYGKVGFANEGSLVDGVWTEGVTERSYFGDVLTEVINPQPGDKVVSDIQVSHRIEVVADAYLMDNFVRVKFVEWSGVLWVATSATIQRPRVLLTLGGVYNGERA